jgi:hypothetical protein
MVGVFIPAALLYLALFVRRNTFSLRTLWRLGVRTILAMLTFAVLGAGLGFLIDAIGETEALSDASLRWMGYGVGIGFFSGIVALIVALYRMVRSLTHRQA